MVRVRPSAPEDVEPIEAMLRQLYLELGEEAESIQFLTADLIRRCLRSGTIVLVAEIGESLCGVVTVTETSAIYAGGKYGVIDEMYVSPSFRSTGVGKALVKAVAELGSSRGWRRIDVTGPTEVERWGRTMGFYEKNGFVFTGLKLKLSL